MRRHGIKEEDSERVKNAAMKDPVSLRSYVPWFPDRKPPCINYRLLRQRDLRKCLPDLIGLEPGGSRR